MAKLKYRQLFCNTWEDEFFEELDTSEKLFWIFLLTGPKTAQCGVFRLRIKDMVFYTGFSYDQCKMHSERLEDKGRIAYNWETQEVCILNWAKYNLSRGGRPVIDCIRAELSEVKDSELILKLWKTFGDRVNKGIERLFHESLTSRGTIRGQEEEREEEREEEIKGKSDDSPEWVVDEEAHSFPKPFNGLSESDLKKKIGPRHLSLLKEGFSNEEFLRGAISLLHDGRFFIYLDWLEYKKKARKGYTSLSHGLGPLLRSFTDFTEAELRAAYDKSVSNGYSGIFPQKQVASINSPKQTQNGINAICSEDTAEELRAAFIAGGCNW